MKAARIARFSPTEAIEITDVARPVLQASHVLIEVRASSINPVDLASCSGRMKDTLHLEPPMTLGFDVAGVVAELGADVRGLAIGDEVFGTAGVTVGGSGAWAELATAPTKTLARRPRRVGFIESAAAALAGASAVQALDEILRLQRDQRILIHGGAGGIGSIAIQIAKHTGAHVTATASGAGIDLALGLGADRVINYKAEDFIRDGRRYDAVLDTVGGDTYERSFEVLVPGGAIVSLKHQIDLELMRLHGVKAFFMLTRMTPAHLGSVARLIDEHAVKIHVDRTFPLDRIREAMRAKEHEHVLGKIGIEIGAQAR